MKNLGLISVVVRDYNEALDFYVNKLGFVLVEDTVLSETKRWVVVAPDRHSTSNLLLTKAATAEQEAHVGNQTGGRVFLFLNTDNFQRDYEAMLGNGVKFVREPKHEAYGTVAVFEDLYGNLWDLIERK
ncbi:MAG: VOC family protein [Cyclobacteriaceae bacterium]|nr:VOC family protein [Cyclobacteriaceae bacterium]